MVKLAVLFNTFVKLKTYNFDALKFDFIAVVEEKEYEQTLAHFGSTFKHILKSKTISTQGDYSDVSADLEEILKHYNKANTRFICLSEDYLLGAAILRKNLGIEGMKPEVAILFRDKILMKENLVKAGVSVPKFIEFSDLETFKGLNTRKEQFAEIVGILGEEFVIKPKSAFGWKDVSIVQNYDEFLQAISGIEAPEEFELETFINGKLYHIDSIYKNGEPIFQVCNEYSCPNFEFRTGHALLSLPLPHEHELSIKASKLSADVIKSFGLANGATHLEFFVTSAGELVFLEVAGRTPGGMAVPMYNAQFEINLPNFDLLNHFGETSNTLLAPKKYCISGIFPTFKGIVKSLNKPNLNGKAELEFQVKEGQTLGECESLRDIAAKIVLENANFENSLKDFNSLKTLKIINVE